MYNNITDNLSETCVVDFGHGGRPQRTPADYTGDIIVHKFVYIIALSVLSLIIRWKDYPT